MKTETITMEIDADLKRATEMLCNDMGLTISAFYTMLLKMIIRPSSLQSPLLVAKTAHTTGNPMLSAVLKAAHSLTGVAEEAGFRSEAELQNYIKEVIRPEIWEEWNATHNA